jgi:proline iminopeptidase
LKVDGVPPDVHGAGRLVEASGLGQVYYEIEGDGDETTIVVPGGPGVSHVHYHPWFSRLTGVGQVVYFDYPGTGRSSRGLPDTYTVASYARSIDAVIGTLGVSEASLIGLSFGGIPALHYALDHAPRVKRLVLSNAQLNGTTWQRTNIDAVNRELREQHPHAWQALIALRDDGILSLDDRYQELVAEALPAMEWYSPSDRPHLRQPDTVEDEFNPEVYRAFCGDDPEWVLGGELAHYDRSTELADVRTPTLVVTGRYDRLTPPAVALEIKDLLRGAPVRLVAFEKSGHRPWAEQPEEYFELVREFLRAE